jgi:pimeloyl-ACP methyl ester carboxylesterase
MSLGTEMKNSICLILISAAIICGCMESHKTNDRSGINYGDNLKAGRYVFVNGADLYYEVYGDGDPIILLHGNGGNIAAMKHQIEYFSKHYKVITMDCRGRGKSELGSDTLTYLQMTEDVISLLDQLHLDSVYVAGRRDGGIISLLMGIYFPERVRKIAAFGANLRPDTTAGYLSLMEQIHRDRVQADIMIQRNDTTSNWHLISQLNRLMEFQPHISTNDLRKIKAPVLILSCDRDVIKEEHTLEIYRNIPNANLCIFPGETHQITLENPALFNSTVAKFFSEPYKGKEIRK